MLFILDGLFHTGPVKSYPSNEYGLCDMVGNVSEWVSDAFVFFEKYESRFKEQKSWTEPDVYTVSGGSCCDDYIRNSISIPQIRFMLIPLIHTLVFDSLHL